MAHKPIGVYIRALRLAFANASALPFIFGSLIARGSFSVSAFILGFIAAVTTHLGANLMNDYADSKSGADWYDTRFYTFFGGSKLIQEGILPLRFYRTAAIICFCIALTCIIGLALFLQTALVMVYALIILFLGISYSYKPFSFSYRRLGEVIIFILFGPALVMGGYFIQTGIFPDIKSFFLSVPFGCLTTAILFSNEIPDFETDLKADKRTWVSFIGVERSYIVYGVLEILSFIFILVNVLRGYIGYISLASLALFVLVFKAALIMKQYPRDKIKLMESSKLTIAVHAFASIILIIGILI